MLHYVIGEITANGNLSICVCVCGEPMSTVWYALHVLGISLLTLEYIRGSITVNN